MYQEPVPARTFDDQRLQTLAAVLVALGGYAIYRTGSTDCLDGFTRLISALNGAGSTQPPAPRPRA